MSTLPENIPPSTAIALLRKHLGIGADYEEWPACYQSLADELEAALLESSRLRSLCQIVDSYLKAPEGSEEVVSFYDQLCEMRGVRNDFPKTLYGYPKDWPTCHSCGAPALDGKVTCGNVECGTIADNQ